MARDYKLIVITTERIGSVSFELEKAVGAAIAAGWSPSGGASAVIRAQDGMYCLFQAMVKD